MSYITVADGKELEDARMPRVVYKTERLVEEIALFASITKTAVVAVAGDTTMGPSSRDNGQLPEAIFPNDFV